jgi:hypothetical protein
MVYKHEWVAAGDLQTYLDAELADGRALVSGNEGIPTILNRGFAEALPPGQERLFSILTTDVLPLPSAVSVYLNVSQTDLATTLASWGGTDIVQYHGVVSSAFTNIFHDFVVHTP